MSQLDFSKWCKNRLASLVSFANAGTDIVATTVQGSIAELASRHFGKQYGYSEDEAGGSTSSPSFQPQLELTLPGAPAGTYRIAWHFRAVSSKSNTDGEVKVVAGGSDLENHTHSGTDQISDGHFKGDYIHTGGDLLISIENRRLAGNGLAIVTDLRLEGWRLT